MPESAELHLLLEITPPPGPIAGVLDHDGSQRPFTGWLELCFLLEAIRSGPRTRG